MKNLPPKELVRVRLLVDSKIDSFFRAKIQKLKKSDPSMVPTYKMLHEFCMRGGKRLRAYLVVVGFKIAGKKPNVAIYDIALGVELLHASLLIHDDVIDNDILRRGKLTVHEELKMSLQNTNRSQEVAIFMGNILSTLALEVLFASKFSDKKKVLAAKIVGAGAISTAVGEIMDISFSHKKVTEQLVEKILLLKTARYSVSQPLILGYVLGDGKKYLSILQKMGDNFGTAFQIKDDTLGMVGEKAKQSRGGDIREAKPFALAPHIDAMLTSQEKMFLTRLVSKKEVQDSELRDVKQLLTSKLIPEKALKKAERYITSAKKTAKRFLKGSVAKEVSEIIDYVIARED